MFYKYVNKINTKYNPCVIEYSSKYQLFVCGTYQLVDEKEKRLISEETLERVNHRLGNLSLITDNNQLIEEYECFDGGVFDLKLIDYKGSEDKVIVAHSNGFVAIYSIDWSNKLQTIRRYSTNSSLLTTLTIITKDLAVVGNSVGKLVSINLTDEMTQQLSVTEFNEPVWTLFSHQINSKSLLFVGSDDSKLRIYSFNDFNEEFSPNSKPIETINDSIAGITSIGSDYSSDTVLSVIVGSYDEFIRFYEIKFFGNELKVNFKHKLHIPDSGIWKIILRDDCPNTILVSGMYSGAHIIKDFKVVQTLDPLDSNRKEEKQLIYGLNCDSKMICILMSSFYDKTVYLFTKT